jgi:uncharacterized phage protein (TIGR02220 family)
MKKNTILGLISGEEYWIINKPLARLVGLEAAVLFSDLCQAQNYWDQKNGRESYFFKVEGEIQADTTLSPYKQREALKKLKEEGLIKTKRKGTPAKKFYLIDSESLNNLLSKVFITSCGKIKQLDDKKLNNPNNSNRVIVIDNSNKKEKEKGSLSKSPPFKNLDPKEKEETPKKVAAKKPPQYLEELKEVLSLFKELTKVGYKIPKKNITKYGAYKLVAARLKEGNALEDLLKVVKFKCGEWLPRAKMRQYCNYNTILRASNFSKYLIELKLTTNANQQTNNNNKQTAHKKGGLLDGLGAILEDSSEKGFI